MKSSIQKLAFVVSVNWSGFIIVDNIFASLNSVVVRCVSSKSSPVLVFQYLGHFIITQGMRFDFLVNLYLFSIT